MSMLAEQEKKAREDSVTTIPHMTMASPLVGKKSGGRPKSPGVVVRLLKDIKKFGREGSIFRIKQATMRNNFFVNNKAEYMTRQRFKELGLTKTDIGQRDSRFGIRQQLEVEELPEDAVEHVAGALPASSLPAIGAPQPAVEVEQLAPNRAFELMESMIPDPIIFERRLVHINAKSKKPEPPQTPEPTKAEFTPTPVPELEEKPEPEQALEPEKPEEILSPLQQRRQRMIDENLKTHAKPEQAAAEVAADKEKDKPATSPLDTVSEEKTSEESEKERKQMEKDADELLKIHGSVSLHNIASYLKEQMLLDPEASRIHVQPEDIKFIGVEEGVDQIKKIGLFEIEIRTHVGKAKVEPIRRHLEIVPL